MNKFIGDDNREELKIKYNAENLKEINEKLQAQIDFLNEENHKLQEKDYFHSHRCREEEIKKLDSQISSLTRENGNLKRQIESINSTNRTIINKEKKMNNEGINKLNEQINQLNNEIIILSFSSNSFFKFLISFLNFSASLSACFKSLTQDSLLRLKFCNSFLNNSIAF